MLANDQIFFSTGSSVRFAEALIIPRGIMALRSEIVGG
jgi:hypothetical protein